MKRKAPGVVSRPTFRIAGTTLRGRDAPPRLNEVSRLRPEQRRMGFRLRQDFGGRVGGTGKVFESENNGF